MHNKQLKIQFIRYGNLIPQKHKVYDWIHSAPVENGVYAFPLYYVEKFLLGGFGAGNIRNGRYTYLKDPSTGKKLMIKLSDFYNTYQYNQYCGKHYDKNDIKEPWKSYLHSLGLKSTDVFPYTEDEFGIFDGEMPAVSDSHGKLYPIAVESKPIKFGYSGDIWHHLEYCMKNKGDIIRRSSSNEWVLTDMQTYSRCLKKHIARLKYNAFAESQMSGSPGGYPLNRFSKDDFEVFIENPKQ